MRTLHPFAAVWFLTVLALAQTPTPAPDLARNPACAAPAIDPALPSLFIAGDSTAARGRGATQQGWAVPFADYFDSAKINIVNRARGGRMGSRRYLLQSRQTPTRSASELRTFRTVASQR